ncbi:MAG: hypothetical protein LBC27_01305 [Spirochaetaceae bacterium]|nr:hypothetical protein [Spirochaetaceae bacterium]
MSNRIRFSVPVFALIFLFVSCGDLDMALSSSKVYKVNAMVNGLSLDECSIVSSDSEIAPYFDFNIKSDPDIAALGVSLKDSRGKETGLRIIYALPSWDPDAKTDVVKENDKKDPVSATETSDEEAAKKPEETSTIEDTADKPVEIVENQGGSQETETPPDDIPAENTVENAAGTDSVTNTTEYTTPRAVLENQTGSALTEIITVEDFYGDLPMLRIGDDLPAGFYTIVFNVIASNGTILNSVEKPFYYLANETLVVEDIISYLPGVSSTTRIVPPGEKVLLEALIQADAAVTPYIVWYNGKDRINEGFAAEGAERIFWVAPAQNGFQNIRIEVFPFNPNKYYPLMRGISRSVSLPISQKHGRNGLYAGMDTQLSRWYRLWGNLKDERDPLNTALGLIKTEDTPVRWLPVSGTYGLAIGVVDAYRLPGAFFKYIQNNEGSGELLFRFTPWSGESDGPLLSAVLQNLNEEGGVCSVWISLTEEFISLNVAYNDEIFEAQTPLVFDSDGFVSAALDFQFFEESTTVSLGLKTVETNFVEDIENWERISIGFIASKEGYIQFGGAFDTPDARRLNSVTSVLTEIAVLYPAVSPAIIPVDEQTEPDEVSFDLSAEIEETADTTL